MPDIDLDALLGDLKGKQAAPVDLDALLGDLKATGPSYPTNPVGIPSGLVGRRLDAAGVGDGAESAGPPPTKGQPLFDFLKKAQGGRAPTAVRPEPPPDTPYDDVNGISRALIAFDKGLGSFSPSPSPEMRALNQAGFPRSGPPYVGRMLDAMILRDRLESPDRGPGPMKPEREPGSQIMQSLLDKAGLQERQDQSLPPSEMEEERDILSNLAGGRPESGVSDLDRLNLAGHLANSERVADEMATEKYPYSFGVPKHLGELTKMVAQIEAMPGGGIRALGGKFGVQSVVDPLISEAGGAPADPRSTGQRFVEGTAQGLGIGAAGKVAHAATNVLGKGLSPTAKAVIPSASIGAAVGASQGPEIAATDALAFGLLSAVTGGKVRPLDPKAKAQLREMIEKGELDLQSIHQRVREIQKDPDLATKIDKPVDVEGQPVKVKTAPPKAEGKGEVELPEKALYSEGEPTPIPPVPQKPGKGPIKSPGELSASKLYGKIQELRSNISSLGSLPEARSGKGVKLPRKTVKGRFDPKTESVSLRVARDLKTFAHEVTHHLQKHLWKEGAEAKKNLSPYAAELKPLATKGKWHEEGFAEFGKLYMTEPAKAKQAAPEFYKAFEKALEVHDPGLLVEVQGVRDYALKYQEQPLEAKIDSTIEVSKEEGIIRLLSENFKEGTHRLYQKAWHNTHSVNRLVKEFVKEFGRELSGRNNPATYMDVMGSMGDAIGHRAIVDGVPRFGDPTGRTASKSLDRILGEVKDTERVDLERYWLMREHDYLYGRDAEGKRIAEGWLERFPDTTIENIRDSIKAHEKKFPNHEKAVQELQDWHNAWLDYAVDAGVMTAAERKSIRDKNEFYAPLRRNFEDVKPSGAPRGGGGVASVPAAVRARKSTSQWKYESPISQTIARAAEFPRLVHRAYARRKIIELIREMPGGAKWAEKQDAATKETKVPIKELEKKLSKELGIKIDTESVKDDAALSFFRPGELLRGDDIVTYRTADGKTEQWKINHKGLLEAMNTWDRVEGIRGTGALRTIKDIYTASVTTTESFITQNMFVDYFIRGIQTGRVNPLDLPKGIGRVIAQRLGKRAGENFQKYLDSGAGFAQLNRTMLKKRSTAIDDLMKKGDVDAKGLIRSEKSSADVGRTVDSAYDFLIASRDLLSDMTESPWRQGVYVERLMDPRKADKGDPLSETITATHEARESSLDFSRRGSSRFLNEYMAWVPFMRPTVQGADKAVRTTIENPVRVAAVLGAAVSLEYVNRMNWESEDWKSDIYANLDGYVKDDFWVVIVPWATEESFEKAKKDGTTRAWKEKHLWKFRKPFEWGVLPTIVQRGIIEPIFQMEKDKKTLGAEWDESLALRAGEVKEKVKGVLESQVPPYLPAFLRPFWEGGQNYNRLRDRSIVSRKAEGDDPEDQYRASTPHIYRVIGDFTGIAPLKIENGMPPGLWTKGVRFHDDIVRKRLGEPEKPWAGPAKEKWGGVFRDLASRWTVNYPGPGSEVVDRYYENIREVQNSDKYIRRMIREERVDRAFEEAQEDHWQMLIAEEAHMFADAMAQITAEARVTHQNKSLTPREKAATFDHLAFTRQILAEDWLRKADEARLIVLRERRVAGVIGAGNKVLDLMGATRKRRGLAPKSEKK